MVMHPISYLGFGFVSFAICLIPFANIAWAGGIAYGSGLLFEEFVNEGVSGPDDLPTPGYIENMFTGVSNAANFVGSGVAGAAGKLGNVVSPSNNNRPAE